MRINIYLDKPDELETYIMLYISLNGFYIRISTGLKIPVKYCQLANGRQFVKIKNSYSLCSEYNSEIERICAFIRTFIIENNNTGQLNKNELLSAIANFKKPFVVGKYQNNLFDIYDKFYLDRKNGVEKKIGTYERYSKGIIQRYESVRKWMQNYAVIEPAEFTMNYFSTIDFFQGFTQFLFRQNLHRNTVHGAIKELKTFAKWAEKKKYVDKIDTSEWKIVKDEVVLFALDENEINRVEQLDLSSSPALAKVRNLFLIQCYTGLRFSDLIELNNESFDMQNKILRVRTLKTDFVVNIPITPKLQAVLEMGDFQTKAKSVSVYNTKIKKIGRLAGLDTMVDFVEYRDGEKYVEQKPKHELMSSHCGRRTFITNALRKGISERLIMKITGHKTLSSFEKYIKLTETEAQTAFMDAFK